MFDLFPLVSWSGLISISSSSSSSCVGQTVELPIIIRTNSGTSSAQNRPPFSFSVILIKNLFLLHLGERSEPKRWWISTISDALGLKSRNLKTGNFSPSLLLFWKNSSSRLSPNLKFSPATAKPWRVSCVRAVLRNIALALALALAWLHFSIFLEENRVRWAGLRKAELLLIGLAELSWAELFLIHFSELSGAELSEKQLRWAEFKPALHFSIFFGLC